ncbi:hypothetical protein [Natrinema thermotolerans]|uniref:hypothetical protein n=1 Tax=Natrinema thermotolerans TaxID=121872 RepID=UPI0006790EC6|nr:hypothetical protein [Natrinema thermotolerans]QCC57245.1 hypothetical protein DVR14_00800 [Natrinema thermotolerans]
MVNPNAIPDGRYVNLYCPECQARPDDLETATDREGYRTLRCAYCLSSLNATLAEYVPTAVPAGRPFDDRLFRTD